MCFLRLFKKKNKNNKFTARKTRSTDIENSSKSERMISKDISDHNCVQWMDEEKGKRESKAAQENKKSATNKSNKQKANNELAAYSTGSLKLIPSNYQHIGSRERQEDSFAFSDFNDNDFVKRNGVLAVVADGMGGLSRGDQASQVAVSILLREYNNKKSDISIEEFMRRALTIANYAVFDLALNKENEEIDLGTTLVAAIVYEGIMHWISVGDSFIFLLQNGLLEQLNKEHIYANQLADHVDNGLISQKEAIEHPERSFLTSYLGIPELKEVDCNLKPVMLNPGDVILLCSDGLTNTLSTGEITAVLEKPSSNKAEELVKMALAKKKRHQDNITVLILSCEAVNNNSNKGV